MPYPRILARMRTAVRDGTYIITMHAEEELEDDGFLICDLEAAILDGEIQTRQIDAQSGESKYVLHGPTVTGALMAVVGKFGPLRDLVIIAVYAL